MVWLLEESRGDGFKTRIMVIGKSRESIPFDKLCRYWGNMNGFQQKKPSTEGKVGIEKSGPQLLYVCNMKRRLVIWTFGNWMFCNWTFVT
jgi:hypothetical protein